MYTKDILRCTRQKLIALKGRKEKSTIIMKYYQTSPDNYKKKKEKKISKNIEDLKQQNEQTWQN